MKWIIVIALSLLLVAVCVVYIQHEKQLKMHPANLQAVTQPVKPHKVSRIRPRGTSAPGPIDISGPLKNRELLNLVLPEYPEWAQQQGIGGILRTKIWVTPAGVVQSFMEPKQLSGEPRLDEIANEAIKQWRFAEKPNAFGDQWGIVTIRFSLLAQENETAGASVHGFGLAHMTASGAWECIRKWVGEAQNEFVYVCKLRKPHPQIQP